MKRLFLFLALIVVAATAVAQYPTEMPKYYIFDKDFNDNMFDPSLRAGMGIGIERYARRDDALPISKREKTRSNLPCAIDMYWFSVLKGA